MGHAARIRIARCWAAVLGASLGLASARAATTAAVDGTPPCADGLLFVGAVERFGVDETTANLVALRVEEGLRFATQTGSAPGQLAGWSGEVTSLPRIQYYSDDLAPALRKLASAPGSVRVEEAFLTMARQRRPLSGYVQISVQRSAASTSVTLDQYCTRPREAPEGEAIARKGSHRPARLATAEDERTGDNRRETAAANAKSSASGGKLAASLDAPDIARGGPAPPSAARLGDGQMLVARKLVRVRDASSEEALLQAAFRAGRSLLSTGNADPVVRIDGGELQIVPLDEERVIDGEATMDPDDDALDLTWSAALDAPGRCRGWRQERGKLYFRSSVPGKCTFTLTASEIVPRGGTGSASASVEIDTIAKPRVRVHENSLVQQDVPVDVRLEGTCASCEAWRWVQLSGPVTTMPKECNAMPRPCDAPTKGDASPADCNAAPPGANCVVKAYVAGVYTFALTGWNVLGEDRKEYSVGVAPPPTAVAYLPDKAITLHEYTFDGSASRDMLGGELRYVWEVSSGTFPGCGAKVPDADTEELHHVRLTSPTSAKAAFTSSAETILNVRLMVLSTRKFGDRVSTSVACAEREIVVENATWLLSLAGGSDVLMKDRSSAGSHVSLVVAVRPSWLPRSVALRIEQNLVRNDTAGGAASVLGGTSVGLSWLSSTGIHPYVTGYGRTWGDNAFGPEVGLDFRLRRFVYMSGAARLEHNRDKDVWRGVLTSALGVAYDL